MKVVAALIVKNEAPVLRRCLASLRKAGIEHIIVNDNGSTDETPQILEEYNCIQVPGPWVDFSTNRNLVLTTARGWGDYVLCGIDADEELVVPDDWSWNLDASVDIYNIPLQLGNLRYPRRSLVRSTANVKWQYVIHELLMLAGEAIILDLGGACIQSYRDGARSRDVTTAWKDLNVLLKATIDYPDEPRYVFYTAQTFKDLGHLNLAEVYYQRRIWMTGYYDERWYSQYMLAKLEERQQKNPVLSYLKAYNMNPARAEPLYHAANWLRLNDQPVAAYALASSFRKPMPLTGLFVEPDIYHWRLLDLVASVSWYANEKQQGAAASVELLMRNFPEDQRARIENNAKLYGVIS